MENEFIPENERRTTISMRVITRKRLKGYGIMGENYDHLLNRILDDIDKRLNRIADDLNKDEVK